MRTSSLCPRLLDLLGVRQKSRLFYPLLAVIGIIFVTFINTGIYDEDFSNRNKIPREHEQEIEVDFEKIKLERQEVFLNDVKETAMKQLVPPPDKWRNTTDKDLSPQTKGNPIQNIPSKNIPKLPNNTFDYFKLENAPFGDYNLNVPLSQTLPLDRVIPDNRPKPCLSQNSTFSTQRKVSVVIPFYNEMWSVLIRTIHSMLNRAPPGLIHEIILVDDNSSFANLLSPLENYMKSVPFIRILRLKKREGLIRARMAGARMATGDTLAFVDAHVEVAQGWLEPLVNLIDKEPKTIAVPVINSIDPQTFEYVYTPIRSQGTFGWDLDFIWKDETTSYDVAGIDPHPTPTMIGCAFVVDREFFFDVGSFDEGMNIWGGEQIEISFRTWMCGGAMKIVPCSHVGHIYRAHLPYAFSELVLYRNLQRIAEVWMDDYRRYYYYTIHLDPFKFTPSEIATINERKNLRKKLNCKSFSWYLDTLVPHIKPPPIGSVLYGNVKNVGSSLCLSKKEKSIFDFNEMAFGYCSLQLESFTFTFTDTGHIVQKGLCLTYRNNLESAVTLTPCDQSDPKQLWSFSPGLPEEYKPLVLGDDVKHAIGSFKLKYDNYSLCLSQMLHSNVDIGGALPCVAMNSHQFWVFTYTLNHQRSFLDVYSAGAA